MSLQNFRKLASKEVNLNKIPDDVLEEAILIRLVEEKFLELFAAGNMNGTVHTCVGQEFSAVAIAGQLQESDWVTSNHRCHGHFISKTKNWKGLVDELMGLKSGVCMGIGSSQHLYAPGFLSNGPQAALVPVATGIALHKKINFLPGISVSFIGEGTLGEGVLYESLNIASLYQVPHLIVCENNLYSQSTPQERGVSGDIIKRAEAFSIKTFEADTWDLSALLLVAKEAIEYTRTGKPAFLLVKTYRLNAHSKGDDNRPEDEVNFFKDRDPLNIVLRQDRWAEKGRLIKEEIDSHVRNAEFIALSFEDYVKDQLPRKISAKLSAVSNPKKRMVQSLNDAYRKTLEIGAVHIGEDIEDPYGGAFKVTKGLSSDFPGHVLNSPISESGLIGVSIGMAIMGTPAFAEIMFGDFITHAFDQLISNASKFYNMYAFQASAPLRIRTPMGGKRGYGPTHSQSLEKHLLGIDNVCVVSLSSLLNPEDVIGDCAILKCPIVLLENKVDYGKYLWSDSSQFDLLREDRIFGSLRLSPKFSKPSITIVSYGETARQIADGLERFFIETDYIPELVCLIQLNPLDIGLVKRSVEGTNRLIIVEDGSVGFGIGSEVIGRLVEEGVVMESVMRIGAEPVPIPSVNTLELEVLPTMDRIIRLARNKSQRGRHD